MPNGTKRFARRSGELGGDVRTNIFESLPTRLVGSDTVVPTLGYKYFLPNGTMNAHFTRTVLLDKSATQTSLILLTHAPDSADALVNDFRIAAIRDTAGA